MWVADEQLGNRSRAYGRSGSNVTCGILRRSHHLIRSFGIHSENGRAGSACGDGNGRKKNGQDTFNTGRARRGHHRLKLKHMHTKLQRGGCVSRLRRGFERGP